MLPDMQITGLQNARVKASPDLTTKSGRLREARQRHFPSAKEAAEAMGVPYGTYSGHESGTRGFGDEEAQRYARFYRVQAEWLTFGRGDDRRRVVPIGGQIGAGGAIDVSTEQSEDGVRFEAEMKAALSPDAVVAYEVVGESMMPRYRPGTLLICGNHATDPDTLLGEELAIGTRDGARYLKVLEPGGQKGRYTLASSNALPMYDVEIVWVAEIVAIIPQKQWKRHERPAVRRGKAA